MGEESKMKSAANRSKPYSRPSNYYAGPRTSWQQPVQQTEPSLKSLQMLLQQPLNQLMQSFQNPFNQVGLQQPFNQNAPQQSFNQNAPQQSFNQQNLQQAASSSINQQQRRFSGPNSICFACNALGHFARDCPLKPAAQGAPPPT